MAELDFRVLEFRQDVNPDTNKLEDWVRFAASDSLLTSQTWQRVSEMRPKNVDGRRDPKGVKTAYFRARWEKVSPLYESWKEGNELPETGTPLAVWGGVNSAQVQALNAQGIRTVEDVAEMSDNVVDRVRLPNVRKLRGAAQEYLASRDNAEMATDLAAAKAEIEAMRAELAAMQKPKRGRPPKADA